MPDPWSNLEVEATVADYFSMLSLELKGEAFNKSAHRRALKEKLKQRTDGAIELKHQNISAILIECGFPYIVGYKPRGNYQALLRQVVTRRLGTDQQLEQLATKQVEADPPSSIPTDILATLVEPPLPTTPVPQQIAVREEGAPPLTKKNYFELETRNRSLGFAGELFVVRFEQERLLAAGKDNLAADVEHVAQTKGDGLGYDILSYETNGQERLIEAKTTAYGASTPLFVTPNELRVSAEHAQVYYLYRLFNFRSSAKLYQKQGSIEQSYRLTPTVYSAALR